VASQSGRPAIRGPSNRGPSSRGPSSRGPSSRGPSNRGPGIRGPGIRQGRSRSGRVTEPRGGCFPAGGHRRWLDAGAGWGGIPAGRDAGVSAVTPTGSSHRRHGAAFAWPGGQGWELRIVVLLRACRRQAGPGLAGARGPSG